MALDALTLDLISMALSEDIGPGDVTSALIPADSQGEAHLVAKESLVLAGTEAFVEVFAQVDDASEVEFTAAEGEELTEGQSFANITGLTRSILSSERVALNILQHMCGIATHARRCAEAVKPHAAKVVDTRKTLPGLRALEKYAVRVGGGHNHRFGLFDGVLIKDNHIAAMGSITEAINAARKSAHHLMKIECEVTSIREFNEAREAGADVILLDNMTLAELKIAVTQNHSRALLEASGNVTLERLPDIAATGVDLISMGSLTHSVKAADISLRWK